MVSAVGPGIFNYRRQMLKSGVCGAKRRWRAIHHDQNMFHEKTNWSYGAGRREVLGMYLLPEGLKFVTQFTVST